MSIYNIATLSDLKKFSSEYISIDDVYNKCDECGRPVILHQDQEGECTRDIDESLEVVAKNWRDLKRHLKPILKEIKLERDEERMQNVYLDGIERIVNTLQINIH